MVCDLVSGTFLCLPRASPPLLWIPEFPAPKSVAKNNTVSRNRDNSMAQTSGRHADAETCPKAADEFETAKGMAQAYA